ncbi:unannotated protein [freshwater metagenome]|uniref:Unannotated protein n=1 Tax=freshwater metagenome TaxID=449393 RepID=A0A6J6GRM0_9ZZZZ
MSTRFKGVVDAFTVKRIHKASSIASNNPTWATTMLNVHRKSPCLWPSNKFTKSPRLAHLCGVGIEHRVEVEIGKVLHRRQRANPDVHDAVAGREHPPVARNNRSVGTFNGETSFHVPVIGPRRRDVATDRKSKRRGSNARCANGSRCRRTSARCNHRELRANLFAFRDDAKHSVVFDPRFSRSVLAKVSAGIDCGLHDHRVEFRSRRNCANRRKRTVGPQHFANFATGLHAQTINPMKAFNIETKSTAFLDRSRRQSIATGFIASLCCLFEQRHRCSATCCPRRGR